MTTPEWALIKYFKPHDFDDSAGINKGEDISMLLVKELDFLRDWIGQPIIVTAGYDSKGHSDNSWHYKGLAVDIIILGLYRTLREQFKYIRMTKFNGIGVYPHWHYKGVEVGGWHLDLRPEQALWREENGEYRYFL